MSSEPLHYPQRGLLKLAPLPAPWDGATAELSISGSHVLVALTIAFCLAGPVTWALVKYWLFAL